MRPAMWRFSPGALFLCLATVLWAGTSDVDEQLLARSRVFPNIGPGLRALKRGPEGNFYLLTSPGTTRSPVNAVTAFLLLR